MDAVHKKRTKKRRRTVISPDEIEKLEESFEKEQKPDRITKLELAKQLSKPESFVNIWFQNRRAKERKINNFNKPQNMYPPCESKNGTRDKETTVNMLYVENPSLSALLAHQSHWLIMSYCDRDRVRRASSVVNNCFKEHLAEFLPNLAGMILIWPSFVQMVPARCLSIGHTGYK